MKKTIVFIALFLICSFLFPGIGGAASGQPLVEAKAAVLIEAETAAVLFSKDSNAKMYPASTTKVLTALLAVESGGLSDLVTVGSEIELTPPGSSLAHLSQGDTLTLTDLVYALLLPSGNDAAYTAAVYLARRQTGDPGLPVKDALVFFAEMMNDRAKELGATNTHFTCPDGFHDDDHYTTAQDLALIARAALTQPFIRAVAATAVYEAPSWHGPKSREWRNGNALINQSDAHYYPQATGLKTGYTTEAGPCLISSASNGNLNLIAVCLSSTKDARWSDAISLFDFGFANYAWRQLIGNGEEVLNITVTNNDWDQPAALSIVAAQGHKRLFSLEDYNALKRELVLDPALFSPKGTEKTAAVPAYSISTAVARGEIVGRLVFLLAGKEVYATDLIASTDVSPLPWQRQGLFQVLTAAAILIALVTLMVWTGSKPRFNAKTKE